MARAGSQGIDYKVTYSDGQNGVTLDLGRLVTGPYKLREYLPRVVCPNRLAQRRFLELFGTKPSPFRRFKNRASPDYTANEMAQIMYKSGVVSDLEQGLLAVDVLDQGDVSSPTLVDKSRAFLTGIVIAPEMPGDKGYCLSSGVSISRGGFKAYRFGYFQWAI